MALVKIDLNCDLGESYGKNSSQYDAAIMPYLSSCNIACGFHSGDPLNIQKTIELALMHNVAIGAHPSFPDLQGFGRRMMHLSTEELQACLLYQITALKGMTEALGGRLHHIKAHGALYNFAAKDETTAQVIAETVKRIDPKLYVYGLPNSILRKACEKLEIKFKKEAFSDRAYNNDLSLRSRKLEGAVLHQKEAVLEQVHSIVLKSEVYSYEGEMHSLEADTICLHSDTLGSVELAKNIHQTLVENGVEIVAT